MFFKRLLVLVLLAGWFSGGVLLAQDADATAEATAEAGDLPQSVPLSGLILNVPAAWSVIPGQQGDIVASNVDLYSLDPNTPFPPETVLIQINLYNTAQLPPEVGEVSSAKQILENIPTGEEKPEVIEVVVNEVTLAKMNANNPQGETIVYAVLVNENTFIFAIAAGITPGELEKNADTIQQVLAYIELDASAPIKEDSLTRYDDIPQSTSPEGFPQLGSPDAPVKIQEISSFACPACRSFHDFAAPVLLERIKAGDVLFEYIPYVGTGHIPNNEQATRAALCAGEQGMFWQFHDALFAWQDFGATAFLNDRLDAGAAALELDTDVFGECMLSDHTDVVIENAITLGNSLAGFVGTPTVLLNGSIVNWNPDELSALIDAEIEALANATAEPTSEATAEADSTAEPTAEATAEN